MEKDLDHQKELQLLPPPPPSSSPLPPSSSRAAMNWLHRRHNRRHEDPSLDLRLSISLEQMGDEEGGRVEALKWQAAEQIRLAAIEKAYAERVRELTRREIQLAQSEFSRARSIWDKAREEVSRAERMRDSATSCMGEITCHFCRQRFRPNNHL